MAAVICKIETKPFQYFYRFIVSEIIVRFKLGNSYLIDRL